MAGRDEWEFLVTPGLTGVDAILGYDWLHRFNPTVEWRAGWLEFCGPTQHVHKLQCGGPQRTHPLCDASGGGVARRRA